MMAPHAGLERRVQAALDAAPGRVPVLVGGCGTGRTTLLHSLADRLGRGACQYIDVERAASTPERFFRAVVVSSPFRDSVLGDHGPAAPASAREAFDNTLAFLSRARCADAAAVVHRHPRGTGGSVEQRVQDRPVGDGVTAIPHPFGLTIG